MNTSTPHRKKIKTGFSLNIPYNDSASRHRHARQREINKEIVRAAKSKGCLLCWGKEELTFHHLRDKEDEVTTLVCKPVSTKKLREEINKCVVLCRTCHDDVELGIVLVPDGLLCKEKSS